MSPSSPSAEQRPPRQPQEPRKQKGDGKNKRTRTGCLTCRARKIKCDERPGSCNNCERVSAKCDWPALRQINGTSDNGGSIGPIRTNRPTSHHIAPSLSSPSSTSGSAARHPPATASSATKSSSDQPPTSTDARGGPRSRSKACVQCRITRCKCSQELPSCSRCRDQNVECQYTTGEGASGEQAEVAVPVVSIDVTPSSQDTSPAVASDLAPRRHGQVRGRTSATPGPSRQMLRGNAVDDVQGESASDIINRLSRSTVNDHVEAFYTYIYPVQSNAFVHRGTLLRDIKTGHVSPVLLLALCAASSKFVSNASPHPGNVWAKEAKTMLILSEEMSLDSVAAALLLAKYEINNGKYESAWVLASIAHRAALALGLHQELKHGGGRATIGCSHGKEVGWVIKETRRRLFWACYCLDRMMSRGQPDYILTQPESIRIQLPCEDHNYQLGIPCTTPMLAPETSLSLMLSNPGSPSYSEITIGLFGHYVQMTGMRYRVLRCTRTPETGDEPPWSPSSTWSRCVLDLQTWRNALAEPFQLTTDTICARQAQGQLSALVMLHIWYDQCLSDLYRLALPGFPESLPAPIVLDAPPGWTNETRSACLRHAQNISDILGMIKEYVDEESFVFLDPSLPICVYESIRVQVQCLFVNRDEWIDGMDHEMRAAKLQEEVEKLMTWVERMRLYFKQADVLLREMRKMLGRHGLRPRTGYESATYDNSGAATPTHPWKRRVQELKEHDGYSPDLLSQRAQAGGQTLDRLMVGDGPHVPQSAARTSMSVATMGDGRLDYSRFDIAHASAAMGMHTEEPSSNFIAGTGTTTQEDFDALFSELNGAGQANFALGMGVGAGAGFEAGFGDVGVGLGAGLVGSESGLAGEMGSADLGNWLGDLGGWMATGYDPFGTNSAL